MIRHRWPVLLITLLLSGCTHSDKLSKIDSRLTRLEEESKQLRSKIDALPNGATLDFQDKCAKQAKVAFDSERRGKDDLTSYTNHYNAKVNKCFIEEYSTQPLPFPTVTRVVSDAFEGKEYGQYFWNNPKGKKYGEVPPTLCKVRSLSGEETLCNSSEEFDGLLKQFMEQ